MLQTVHYKDFVAEEFRPNGPFFAIELTDLVRQNDFRYFFEESNIDIFPGLLNYHFVETIANIETSILTRSPAVNDQVDYDRDNNMVYIAPKIKNELVQHISPFVVLSDKYKALFEDTGEDDEAKIDIKSLVEDIRSKKMCVYLCIKSIYVNHNYEAYSSSSTVSLDYLLYIDFV